MQRGGGGGDDELEGMEVPRGRLDVVVAASRFGEAGEVGDSDGQVGKVNRLGLIHRGG